MHTIGRRMSRLTAVGLLGVAGLAASSAARADTMTLSDDAHVNQALPWSNFGGAGSLLVRNHGGGGATRGFTRFDFSALPEHATIARATLRLWVDDVGNPGAVDVHLVTAPGASPQSGRATSLRPRLNRSRRSTWSRPARSTSSPSTSRRPYRTGSTAPFRTTASPSCQAASTRSVSTSIPKKPSARATRRR